MAGAAKNRSRREQQASSSGPPSSGGPSTRSTARTSDRSSPRSIGARYDGPKDATGGAPLQPGQHNVNLRNLELSFGMFAAARGGSERSNTLPQRSAKLNSLGREVAIGLNTFHVKEFPTKPVHQYDITISGAGEIKPMMVKKVWKSQAVQKGLDKSWLFDGNKLAWSLTKLPQEEVTIKVDLDIEEGHNSSGKNRFMISIRYVGQISFSHLRAYLANQAAFDDPILETLSFLDHLMRESPSQKYTQIKKSFFARGQNRFSLGAGVEAFKGVFSSIRIAHNISGGPCLSVNVDVANGTFFTEMDVKDMARELCRVRTDQDLMQLFARSKRDWHSSAMYRYLRALTHTTVVKKYMPAKDGRAAAEFKINRFINKDPYESTFEKDGKKITHADYFRMHYQIICTRGLPIVELTKKGELVPIELLHITQNNRYRIKLDDKQTSNMIKFAVTLPKERWAAVEHGVGMLGWANDPYLNNYGLKISATRAEVKGRVLPTPEPTFAVGKIDAKTAGTGRWRIDGKKFLTPNTRPLKVWGVAIVNAGRGACITTEQARNFFTQFTKIYRTHGGGMEGEPCMMEVKTVRGGDMITDIWNATGNKFQAKPQLLFFVVPDKNSDTYMRIKKSCECRYGVVSQVMQSAHVQKAQDQYISNVCMKVNAKLGGSTCRAAGILQKIDKTWGGVPTMIIGADVSHAAPGSTDGSMAALTVSMNKDFTRYAAACNTNGNRVEIISTDNITGCLKPIVEVWMAQFGGRVPDRVMFYRDGVSEGQYAHVLAQEVTDMKRMFRAISPKAEPKFTVVICAKRHHIRFFPTTGGDRNGNPVPGTLVETGCTQPFEFDFYLAAHSAIKGTARPVHYHVILNEGNYSAELIEQLTFEHCFQYARSTTPVSMFPAVYYAHLASNRAKAHANAPAVSSGKKETAERQDRKDAGQTSTGLSTSDKEPTDIPPLMALNNQLGIQTSMWYI